MKTFKTKICVYLLFASFVFIVTLTQSCGNCDDGTTYNEEQTYYSSDTLSVN